MNRGARPIRQTASATTSGSTSVVVVRREDVRALARQLLGRRSISSLNEQASQRDDDRRERPEDARPGLLAGRAQARRGRRPPRLSDDVEVGAERRRAS